MNTIIERLANGLIEKGLLDCINLIILSDHGMAPVGPAWTIDIEDYIPDVYERAYVQTGAFARLDPKNKSDGECFNNYNPEHETKTRFAQHCFYNKYSYDFIIFNVLN